jgi:hypothetical protein
MDLYTIIRKSPDTAEGDEIILRETNTTRLVFKPMLVNNAQDSDAPVKGSFVFQRKRKGDKWEDHSEVQLSNLRADDWVKLELKASEVDKLLRNLAAMYRLYRGGGLPKGKARFIRVDLDEEDSPNTVQLDIRKLLKLSRKVGVDAFSEFVEYAVQIGNTGDVLLQLERLDIDTLQRLNSLVGITTLKSVLQKWEANQENNNEEFWQQTFQGNAFILSQVFSFPVLIIQGKAYIGGKAIDNKGGHLADFLASNPITKNAVIVEIKTPCTKLLGKKYRGDVYSLSEDLSGSINQVLNYRYNLVTDFLSTRRRYEDKFDVFSPHCLVIAGHARHQLKEEDQSKCFEMARSSFKDAMVITYDELFEKTTQLLTTLEGTAAKQGS